MSENSQEKPAPLNANEEEGRQKISQQIANLTAKNEWVKAEKLRHQILEAAIQGTIDYKTALDTMFPHSSLQKDNK